MPGGETVALYSYEAAVEILIERDRMEPDVAAEYLDYTYVACHGQHNPVWLHECEACDVDEASRPDEVVGRSTMVRVFGRPVHGCARATTSCTTRRPGTLGPSGPARDLGGDPEARLSQFTEEPVCRT